MRARRSRLVILGVGFALLTLAPSGAAASKRHDVCRKAKLSAVGRPPVGRGPFSHRTAAGEIFTSADENSQELVDQGRDVFRFDTFGDEAFWGGELRLQESVATLTPRQALDLGLKVDVDALSPSVVEGVLHGKVDLDDPKVTQKLLRANAVLGVTGFFGAGGNLTSVGLQCALCHSTVDDSVAPGIGRRLDGLANHDLDVGAIIASAPNLQPFVDLLRLADPSIDDAAVRAVLRSWGPGKFDAELFLDGKAMTPDGKPAATLIPNASGLAGHNLHTWTGGWGTVTYWNALVAVLEMHGIGTFFDARFDDATQFPIAARAGLGHISVDPDSDRVTSKLPALHVYQLALPSPKPRPGVDFDPDAAERGDELFSGKANCNSCHHEPLWTEPGWNDHKPEDIRIESFQADRSPDHAYRTMNLAGLFVRERGLFMKPENKGRFYHDGRFATLLDVVHSYDRRFGLGLTEQEAQDLVEYLKSL
jgi:Cytochrome c